MGNRMSTVRYSLYEKGVAVLVLNAHFEKKIWEELSRNQVYFFLSDGS